MSDAVVLESPLPGTVPGERANAVLLGGHAPTSRTPRLTVAGAPVELAAHGLRRPDLGSARRCFWAIAPLPAAAPGTTIEVAADGVALGSIAVTDAPPRGSGTGSRIAVCLATYEPDAELLRAQLDSLRAQTDTDWVCVLSDDASTDTGWQTVTDAVGDDARFELHRATERGGFYRNFERALELAPADCGLVALCDQDDVWHPDKLATLRGALGDASLVYSDQRLTRPDGTVLRDTFWTGRRRDDSNIGAMLVAGSITGAATLMRRDVADRALPFPRTPGVAFHDHWISLVALTLGEIAHVDRPLYDYVQHPGAVFGDVTSGATSGRVHGAAAWFHGYLPRAMQARVLLDRCAPTGDKRAALEAFLDADRSLRALARLAISGLRDKDVTLGSELELAAGPLWRRAASTRLVGDSTPPPPVAFEQRRLRAWRARL